MTIADLCALATQRSRRATRDMVRLAWRTAYYHRVKTMPDLRDELADLEPEGERDVGPGGAMTEERMWRVWGKIKGGLTAWNARLEAEAAAAGRA